MGECVGIDGAKLDPKGIQSVPWLGRFVVYHGGGPGSTWDLWWISDAGTRFSLSTAVLVSRYHLTMVPYAFICHQPHIIASDSVVKQHTKK